jgi:hypothetical protein
MISLWAQAVSLAGLDPREYFPKIWIVEPSLTLVVWPLVLAVFRNGVRENPLRLPAKAQSTLVCLMFYYVFQFYRFLYHASTQLRSSDTWQMFSAGWIVLFTTALIYYFKPGQERRAKPPAPSQA